MKKQWNKFWLKPNQEGVRSKDVFFVFVFYLTYIGVGAIIYNLLIL